MADPAPATPAIEPPAPRRGLMRKPRAWIGTGIAMLMLAALLWLLFAPDPLELEIATLTQGPMQVTVDNQGQVRVQDRYIVAAPVAARLQRIVLNDGERVSREQKIAILLPLPLDLRQRQEAVARLESARALAREAGLRVQRSHVDLQFARSERARVERLFTQDFISSQALDKARTTEEASRSEWHAARLREQAAIADARAAEAALVAAGMSATGTMRELHLTSPVDGYIVRVHEKSERIVNAGAPLITIGDPTRYEVLVDVLSTDAVKIRPGNLMLLEGWGGGKTLQARVRLVEPVAFTKISALGVEEQRVNVIADPVNPLGPLGDGYRIEARIVIWSSERVSKLAGSSLFRVGDGWHVFVVENGRAREQAVEVGPRNQDEAVILAGLELGTAVIRFPSNQIKNGMRVKPASPGGKQE